jgi:hypothetical protein
MIIRALVTIAVVIFVAAPAPEAEAKGFLRNAFRTWRPRIAPREVKAALKLRWHSSPRLRKVLGADRTTVFHARELEAHLAAAKEKNGVAKARGNKWSFRLFAGISGYLTWASRSLPPARDAFGTAAAGLFAVSEAARIEQKEAMHASRVEALDQRIAEIEGHLQQIQAKTKRSPIHAQAELLKLKQLRRDLLDL